MGTLIAFVFPSTMFLHVVTEKTSARFVAKVSQQNCGSHHVSKQLNVQQLRRVALIYKSYEEA